VEANIKRSQEEISKIIGILQAAKKVKLCSLKASISSRPVRCALVTEVPYYNPQDALEAAAQQQRLAAQFEQQQQRFASLYEQQAAILNSTQQQLDTYQASRACFCLPMHALPSTMWCCIVASIDWRLTHTGPTLFQQCWCWS
jgi:hypothetical protein